MDHEYHDIDIRGQTSNWKSRQFSFHKELICLKKKLNNIRVEVYPVYPDFWARAIPRSPKW